MHSCPYHSFVKRKGGVGGSSAKCTHNERRDQLGLD